MGDKTISFSGCSGCRHGTDEGGALQNERVWHAAYTKMHHERKAAQRLQEQGIETYVPVQTKMRQWSDRIKKADVVVLSAMLFVRIDKSRRLEVLQDPSVSRFLTAPGDNKPAIIPDDQMERFRFMVDRANTPVQFDVGSLVEGDPVRVVRGSLVGLEGTFIREQSAGRLYVKMDMLGAAGVEISADDVEPVKQN